jgi:hypothetical protein
MEQLSRCQCQVHVLLRLNLGTYLLTTDIYRECFQAPVPVYYRQPGVPLTPYTLPHRPSQFQVQDNGNHRSE